MPTTLVALLAAATLAVPLTRHVGLGSVLGYLLAGVLLSLSRRAAVDPEPATSNPCNKQPRN